MSQIFWMNPWFLEGSFVISFHPNDQKTPITPSTAININVENWIRSTVCHQLVLLQKIKWNVFVKIFCLNKEIFASGFMNHYEYVYIYISFLHATNLYSSELKWVSCTRFIHSSKIQNSEWYIIIPNVCWWNTFFVFCMHKVV